MGRPVIYLDTSVIVPLFLPEPRSQEAENLLLLQDIIVSDLAVAEFSSAIALAVRIGRIQAEGGRAVLTQFDAWAADHALIAEARGEDFAAATRLIRRFELALRTPDALHIALAVGIGAKLATFDAKMAAAAAAIGMPFAP